MAKLKSALPQVSPQDIDGNESPEIANVAVIVNRGATGIHADFVIGERPELLDLAGHSVVEAEWHSEENLHSRERKEKGSNAPGVCGCRDRERVGAQAFSHQKDVVNRRNDGERKRGSQERKAGNGDPALRLYLQQQYEKYRRHLGESVGLTENAGPEVAQSGNREQHRARS